MTALTAKIHQFNYRFQTNTFALTWNPPDSWQKHLEYESLHDRFKDIKKQMKLLVAKLMHLTNEYGDPYIEHIKLYPDLSFPEDLCTQYRSREKRITKMPRVHWHGTLTLSKYGTQQLPQFLHSFTYTMNNRGMFNLDTCPDTTEWITYAQKFMTLFPEYSKYKHIRENEIILTDDEDSEPEPPIEFPLEELEDAIDLQRDLAKAM